MATHFLHLWPSELRLFEGKLFLNFQTLEILGVSFHTRLLLYSFSVLQEVPECGPEAGTPGDFQQSEWPGAHQRQEGAWSPRPQVALGGLKGAVGEEVTFFTGSKSLRQCLTLLNRIGLAF